MTPAFRWFRAKFGVQHHKIPGPVVHCDSCYSVSSPTPTRRLSYACAPPHMHNHYRPMSSGPSENRPSLGRTRAHSQGSLMFNRLLITFCNTSCCVCLVRLGAAPSRLLPPILAGALNPLQRDDRQTRWYDETCGRRS